MIVADWFLLKRTSQVLNPLDLADMAGGWKKRSQDLSWNSEDFKRYRQKKKQGLSGSELRKLQRENWWYSIIVSLQTWLNAYFIWQYFQFWPCLFERWIDQFAKYISIHYIKDCVLFTFWLTASRKFQLL